MSYYAPYGTYAPEDAANFIEQWEGFRERAYRCPAGKLTIGFGHTVGVQEGDVVTYSEAYALLVNDVKRYVDGMARWINVDVTKGQFIALTSLAFNVGTDYVIHKCPKLMRALNTGDEEECAKQFLDITKCNGVELPGLVRRRTAEAKLFLEDTE